VVPGFEVPGFEVAVSSRSRVADVLFMSFSRCFALVADIFSLGQNEAQDPGRTP
jgi:hypothetical protein